MSRYYGDNCNYPVMSFAELERLPRMEKGRSGNDALVFWHLVVLDPIRRIRQREALI